MNVPPEAVQAAAEALLEFPDPPTRFERDRWRIVMRMSLEAAAPLIRANERERIAQLAQDVAATYVHQGEYTGGPRSARPFADLIRKEATT